MTEQERTPAGGEEAAGRAEGPLAGLVLEQRIAIRKRVFDELRRQILYGRIPPGTRLVEAKLAADLGVSRTPIREALHLLEVEGLLESLPRVGYRVRTVEWEEVEDVFAIRLANETLAARWAATRALPEEIADLEQNMLAEERAVAEGHTEVFVDLDAEFHEILFRASGSRRLLEICQGLRHHMLLFRVESLWLPETIGLASQGHQRIFDAIRAGNAAEAGAALAAHLEDAKTNIQRFALQERRGRQCNAGMAEAGPQAPAIRRTGEGRR